MFERFDAPGSKRHLVLPRTTSVMFGGIHGDHEDNDNEKTAEIHGVTCDGCPATWRTNTASTTSSCDSMRLAATGCSYHRGGPLEIHTTAGTSIQDKDVSQDRQQNDEAAKFQGIACHSCDARSIHGALWECEDCSSYKLCTTCYLNGVHDHDHMFARLDAPRKRYQVAPRASSVMYGGSLSGHERTVNERAVHNITCKSCSHRGIVGTRWKCAVCIDYDLCSKCFRDHVHDLDHVFLRFNEPGSPGLHVVPQRIYECRRTADTSAKHKDACGTRQEDKHARKRKASPDGDRCGPNKLARELRQLKETLQCAICMERRRNVAFLCGHSSCADCAKTLEHCHMCRVRIRKITLY
ncbi:hypothetical protein V5799_027451 [Amblyomma americanum]|uniref:Uncharacterized protein n=1 Tax=Amblyomma americanum TaxID=6943 RepID=A0AAQ4DFP3_AMBAM